MNVISDTMARLVQTMEFDFSAKSFITLVVRTLQGAVCHQPLEGARESCYIFYEILCYRQFLQSILCQNMKPLAEFQT